MNICKNKLRSVRQKIFIRKPWLDQLINDLWYVSSVSSMNMYWDIIIFHLNIFHSLRTRNNTTVQVLSHDIPIYHDYPFVSSNFLCHIKFMLLLWLLIHSTTTRHTIGWCIAWWNNKSQSKEMFSAILEYLDRQPF